VVGLCPGAKASGSFQMTDSSKDVSRGLRAGVAYLRLERRGQRLLTAVSIDGKKWYALIEGEPHFELPRKVKVGVFAAAPKGGPYKATFDSLQLTQHRAKP
jgi:regulation of enolase protein 1 (concanavalin A-like superfamily)